ncbi:MAG: SDR family oxidoreductase [Proteobacteria bacterium]|nr:SDR family oxidoreductase [Pseudomonadota bacterium]
MKTEKTNRNEKPMDEGRRNFVVGTAAAAVSAGLTTGIIPNAFADSHKPSKIKEFAGRSAFVTGAARGIGYACAESLARRGANIVLFDIAKQIKEVPYPLATSKDLANAKKKIESFGVKCIAVKGDVRDGKAQAAAMKRAVSEFGSLDFVVANAGITQIGAMEGFSEAELSLVIDINLKGVIKTVGVATPILKAQKSGRIVMMSSVTGRTGSPNFPIYSATKWGVIGLTKSTAMALGKFNVTCNALCPTLVHTKLLDNDYVLSRLVPGRKLTFEQFNQAAKGRHILPVGLFGAEHVGEAAAYLCSEGSAMISGDVFDIGAGANAQFPA